MTAPCVSCGDFRKCYVTVARLWDAVTEGGRIDRVTPRFEDRQPFRYSDSLRRYWGSGKRTLRV